MFPKIILVKVTHPRDKHIYPVFSNVYRAFEITNKYALHFFNDVIISYQKTFEFLHKEINLTKPIKDEHKHITKDEIINKQNEFLDQLNSINKIKGVKELDTSRMYIHFPFTQPDNQEVNNND